MGRSRGQAHALEGIVAGLVLLSGLVFALQSTAVTPLSASTASQQIENQQQSTAEGVLATAAANGSLKNATLAWNETEDQFPNPGERGYYTQGGPPNAFGHLLNRTFEDRNVAFNVYLIYLKPVSGTNSPSSELSTPRRLVYRGAPSDNAVSASRSVTLYDSDRLRNTSGVRGSTLNDSSSFYASGDAFEHSSVYTVVQVRVIVWRM
jgi:hypothetical protein